MSRFKNEEAAKSLEPVIIVDGVTYHWHSSVGRSYRTICSGRFRAITKGQYVDVGPYVIYGPGLHLEEKWPYEPQTPQEAQMLVQVLNEAYARGCDHTRQRIKANIFRGV